MICQVLADVLNRPVEAVENPRLAGATGAAALMAVGFGILPDIKAIKTMIRVRAVYQPTPQNAEVYNRIFPVFKALYKNNKKAYAALNGAGPRKQEEKI